jgi:hypothetical protein
MKRSNARRGGWVLGTIACLAWVVGAGGATGADQPALIGHWKPGDSPNAPNAHGIAAISADGATLATSDTHLGGRVRVWDVRQGKLKKTLNPPGAAAARGGPLAAFDLVQRSMAFSADGKRLAVLDHLDTLDPKNNSDKVRVWDVEQGTLVCQIDVPKTPTAPGILPPYMPEMAFSADGHRVGLCIRAVKQPITVFDARSGGVTATVRLDAQAFCLTLAFTPDRKKLAAAILDETPPASSSRTKSRGNAAGHKIEVFDLEASMERTGAIPMTNQGWTTLAAIAFAEDGKTGVTLWGTLTGESVVGLKGPAGGAAAKTVKVDRWGIPPGDAKLTSGSVPAALGGIGQPIEEPNWAIAQDTAVLAIIAAPRSIQIWDLMTGKLRTTVAAPDDVTSVALSRSGRFLAAWHRARTSDDTSELGVWDVSPPGAAKVAESSGPAASPRPSNTPDFRTWTSAGGKFTVEAQFVEVADGQVTLKGRDGKTIRVALKDLSAADQQYVKPLQGQ